jgi:hypothetical protein
VAKNLPKNSFRKYSKVVDFQQENGVLAANGRDIVKRDPLALASKRRAA